MTTLAAIQATVARHYGVTVTDLCSGRQTSRVTWPRQVAMLLCQERTGHSLAGIGRGFGERHWSTVRNAVARVERCMAEDEAVAEEVAGLREAVAQVNGAPAPSLSDPEMLDRLRRLLNSRHAAERQLAGLEREIADLLESAGWHKSPPPLAERAGGG